MADQRVLRFGVGSESGDRFAVWRMWAGNNSPDLYLSQKPTGDAIKVSVHDETVNVSITYEFLKSQERQIPLPNDSRHFVKGKREVLGKGVQRVFLLSFPHSSIAKTNQPYDGSNPIVWIPVPEAGQATEVNIVISDPGARFTNHPGATCGWRLIGSIGLSDGSIAWAVHTQTPDVGVSGSNRIVPASGLKYVRGDAEQLARITGNLRAMIFGLTAAGVPVVHERKVNRVEQDNSLKPPVNPP